MSLTSLIAIFLVFYIVKTILEIISKVKDKRAQYWNGPIPTNFEKRKAKESIFRIIEDYPDGAFAKNNPEYVEEYLNSIQLDLPEGITTTKSTSK